MKTRADKIREMNDKELCEFIVELEENARRSPIVHGTKSTMEWLEEEVREYKQIKVTGLGSENPKDVKFEADEDFSFDFEEVTDTYGNVFIKIPKMSRRVDEVKDDQIVAYTLSTGCPDGFDVYPCFLKEDGKTEMDYILVGKYLSAETDESSINSQENEYPSYYSIGIGRTLARSLGDGYQQYDWQIHKPLQDLICCYLKTIDTNKGRGLKEVFGIKQLEYGNWIDGAAQDNDVWVFSRKPSCYINKPKVGDLHYHTTTYRVPNREGCISKLGYHKSYPFANFPSETTSEGNRYNYYCDMFWSALERNLPIYCWVGATDAAAGVFSCDTRSTWTSTVGVRLCYRPVSEDDQIVGYTLPTDCSEPTDCSDGLDIYP